MTNHNAVRTPRDAEMAGLLEELEASGGNISAFARGKGLSAWKLYEARRASSKKRARRQSQPRVELLPVELLTEAPACSPPPLELVLPSGHRIHVPAEFEESSLRRLIGVLASC